MKGTSLDVACCPLSYNYMWLNIFSILLTQDASSGGALKPTDVEALWVHVTCAWFRPEVAFLNAEKMEPAVGLCRIPPSSFTKVGYSKD